jgi:hypothetical protein
MDRVVSSFTQGLSDLQSRRGAGTQPQFGVVESGSAAAPLDFFDNQVSHHTHLFAC